MRFSVLALVPLITFVTIILPVQLWDAPVRPDTVTELQIMLLIVLGTSAVANYRGDFLTPLNAMVGYYCMFFFVGAAYGFRYEDLGSNPLLIRCYLLVILGFIAFVVGYSLPLLDGRVKRLPRFASDISNHHLSVALMISLGAAAVLFVYFFSLIGGISNYLSDVQSLRTVASQGRHYILWGITLPLEATILWYATSVKCSAVRPVLFVPKTVLLTIIVLTLVIPLGNRIFFVHFLFSLLICRLWLVPRRRVVVCFCVLGLMLTGTVVYQLYRYSTANYIAVEDIPAIMAEPESTFRYTAGEFAVLDDLAFALETWPSRDGYLLGLSYLNPIILPIPRALWPTKPSLAVAFWVNVYLHGYDDATKMGGIGVTAIGEGYVNFGIPGVIVNMLLLGLISRLMYRYVRCNPGNSVVVSIYGAFLFFLFLALQSEVSLAVPYFLQYVIPLIVFYKIASRSSGTVGQGNRQRSFGLAGRAPAPAGRVLNRSWLQRVRPLQPAVTLTSSGVLRQ